MPEEGLGNQGIYLQETLTGSDWWHMWHEVASLILRRTGPKQPQRGSLAVCSKTQTTHVSEDYLQYISLAHRPDSFSCLGSVAGRATPPNRKKSLACETSSIYDRYCKQSLLGLFGSGNETRRKMVGLLGEK